MHTEQEIRREIKKLKKFYLSLLTFVGVSLVFTLIWLFSDRGTPFWPKYIIVIWGGLLAFRAYRMKLFAEYITFLTPAWEEKKVNELMHKEENLSQKKVPLKRDEEKKAPSSQKPTVQRKGKPKK